MNNEMVTIIVPVYNVEQYLDRWVESIVNYPYSLFQLFREVKRVSI